MSNVATFVQDGKYIDYIPSGSNVAAGDVIVIGGGIVGVADRAIPDGKVGALHIEGIYRFKAAGAISAGAKVTLASSGKISAWTSAATDPVVGIALNAATSDGDAVNVLINGQAAALAAAGVNAAAIAAL